LIKRNNGKYQDLAAADKPALCVICRERPQQETYRPFCSKRCADIDLHRWLGGVYAIPAGPDEDTEELAPDIGPPAPMPGDDKQ
jgi:uncharacterized protein